MKVFFIGKVSAYDWRADIVNWQENCKIDEDYDFMGPFYEYLGEGSNSSRTELFNKNLNLIWGSDVIFAYIDDSTAYGALFELGYCYCHMKPVYLYFKKGVDYKDFWFTSMAAEQVFVVKDHKDAWNLFKRRGELQEFGNLKKVVWE